jgi:hypothetical protein
MAKNLDLNLVVVFIAINVGAESSANKTTTGW